jgi:hypothetical protein
MDERTAVDRAPRFRWDGAVPKYDAFGREIGENPLAGLGGDEATARPEPAPQVSESWESSVSAAPAEAPAPEAPEFRAPEAPAPQPVRVRRARGLGCLVGLVILAAVVAGPVIAIVSIVGSASDTIDDVTGALDGIATLEPPDAPEAPAEPPPPPAGVTGRSMIAPTNFAPVLRQLRADGVPAIVQIRLSPDRADLETYRRGRTRRVEYRYDGTVNRGLRGRAVEGLGRVPVADLDARAPVRLVRNAAKRFRVRERGINYLIASEDVFSGDGGHRWIAYFKNGIYVEGDERGRVVRRIS